jgi:uncharacterized glyoxalase superfamily protein PhnB
MNNRSAPGGAIWPTIIYPDVARAIDWLCGAFGFAERLRVGNSDGKVGHAQLTIGSGGVMLGAARVGQGFDSSDTAEFRPPRAGEVSMYLAVRVDDVDQHCERAKRYGARILSPPTTHSYGERQYVVEDLAGYRWTFSQTVADVDPGEWGATVRCAD